MRNILIVVCMILFSSLQAQPRREILLEKNWKFSKGDTPEAYHPEYDDHLWESVSIPHDWAIYGPFDKEIDLQNVAITQNGETVPSEKTGRTGSLPYIGTGWYRTTFDSPEQGKKVILMFDGAMSEARVYVNGQEAGYWPYGYNSFYLDITALLNDKNTENILAVRLENQPQSSRWYPGAGLYRPVRLIVTDPVSVKPWGVYVTTPQIAKDFAKVRITLETENTRDKEIWVETTIKDPEGVNIHQHSASGGLFPDGTYELLVSLANPLLWSPETPYLYHLEISLYEGERLTDTYTTRFGIRSVEITPGQGFVLNGKPRKLKGVCLHHDLGPLGAAINKAALRRQIAILKEMGCDAIRTAHNMPSPWQMELCDEMGMMVMAESFDEWARAKCKNGYNRFFEEWVEKDLVNLIRCHRNHPSIIMWCVGNEIPEQGMKHGSRLAHRLQAICHREDPARPVTCGMDRVDAAVKNQFAAVFDVPGLNYRTHLYESAYEALPQGFMLGSETASTVSSRGVYKFPVVEGKDQQWADHQCSSYDLGACSWSNIPEDDWLLQDDAPWVIGEFVWTGFDYLGEPTPYDEMWPSRSSYFGICDLAGLPKDRYYLYRSRWNREAETIHLLPHWNWEGREGEITPVYCYTNHPTAELFVNGKSQGKISKDPAARVDRYRLRWNEVVYEPGSLKVVVYNQAGEIAGEKEIKTAGKPYRIELEADRPVLEADGKDLAFVTVRIVDSEGNLCPLADNQLNFQVKGAGNYRAACNGDATSLELFHKPTLKAFNGMLVAVVQSSEKAGDMELTVSGKELKSGKIKIGSR
ncbi:MAG: DUF4982 domain-containing protein [Bacteroides sp.]|nr:DUF4982 domain-containing protein [Bacteroides sp.]